MGASWCKLFYHKAPLRQARTSHFSMANHSKEAIKGFLRQQSYRKKPFTPLSPIKSYRVGLPPGHAFTPPHPPGPERERKGRFGGDASPLPSNPCRSSPYDIHRAPGGHTDSNPLKIEILLIGRGPDGNGADGRFVARTAVSVEPAKDFRIALRQYRQEIRPSTAIVGILPSKNS